MPELLPLAALRPGQVADIRLILGPEEQIRRLGELGLHVGGRLEMVRGDSTCIVRVGGAKLCLRGCQFLQVMVQLRLTA